jgi:hypothetical protein
MRRHARLPGSFTRPPTRSSAHQGVLAREQARPERRSAQVCELGTSPLGDVGGILVAAASLLRLSLRVAHQLVAMTGDVALLVAQHLHAGAVNAGLLGPHALELLPKGGRRRGRSSPLRPATSHCARASASRRGAWRRRSSSARGCSARSTVRRSSATTFWSNSTTSRQRPRRGVNRCQLARSASAKVIAQCRASGSPGNVPMARSG